VNALLADKYQDRIKDILARYPEEHRRAAVMPLMYLAQQEYGHLSRQAVGEVADILGLDPTEVGKLVRFYTLFHDEPGGRSRVQICTDLPCALRGAEDFARQVCENLGVKLGETTDDGKVTVEAVMCLAACDRAPMFQVQDSEGIHYHENQTVESAMQTIDRLRERSVDG
jgi:NADH-quinone oxidoreductase subunit E